jgi:hypothetical protein
MRWAYNNLGRVSSVECWWNDSISVPGPEFEYHFAGNGYFELLCPEKGRWL